MRASPAKGRSDVGFPLQALLTRLPEVVVHGIPTVQRAVINRQTDGRFQLFAEGTDLRVSCLINVSDVVCEYDGADC